MYRMPLYSSLELGIACIVKVHRAIPRFRHIISSHLISSHSMDMDMDMDIITFHLISNEP